MVDKLSFPSCLVLIVVVSHASLYIGWMPNQMGHISECLGVYDSKPHISLGLRLALMVERFT